MESWAPDSLSCHKLENCFETLDKEQSRSEILARKETKKVTLTVSLAFCLEAFSEQEKLEEIMPGFTEGRHRGDRGQSLHGLR